MAQNKLDTSALPKPVSSLPQPVPLRAATGSSTAENNKKERKEISMTLKAPSKSKMVEGRWAVESSDEEEEDELSATMNSVRKAVDDDKVET